MFPVSRSRLRQRHYGPATFESVIYSLFANGEQGAAYDPNDLSSMWQDAAGTVPVTAAGQPVGRIIDKSGRGNHATQPTAASRPMLRQSATTGAYYLEFDGSDDFLRTNNIDFTSTDKVAIFAGVRKLSDVSIGVLFELSANTNTNAGVFAAFAPLSAGVGNITMSSKGTALAVAIGNVLAGSPPFVYSGFGNIANDQSTLRINGAQVAQSTADQGTGNYGNHPLYIGRRAGTSLPFTGHLYSLVIVGRLTTDTETRNTERLIAKNVGVQLV